MTWQLFTFLVLALALGLGFAWFERSRPPARVVALVAALAALAVVGRLAFAAFPNVKPTTDIILLAGFALGAAPGFAVGAVTALASNLFLGQGPWTPWQMFAWGLVGIAGAVLARLYRGKDPSRWVLATVCAFAGLAFGAILDFYQWTLSAEQTLATYVTVSGTSLPYNLAHAFGNFVFALVIGPAFLRALRRYRRHFEFTWDAPQAASASRARAVSSAVTLPLVALLAGALLFGSTKPAEASTVSEGRAWLAGSQNSDGGFGGARGQSSNGLHTGWAALGLASAGRNPRDVQKGKRSVIGYIKAKRKSLTDIGEIERTILVLHAAGLNPRDFAGRDLVKEVKRKRGSNGSWSNNIGFTAFGVFALRAGGASAKSLSGSGKWLAQVQRSDGGFGFVPASASDTDDTGAALQALAITGRRKSTTTTKAVKYLRNAQNVDGGFGQRDGQGSNAQSTAWAIQGLIAAGRDPAKVRKGGNNPISYISSLQQKDGSVRYSRTSTQTPVWVTAQALTALKRQTFPIATVKRSAAAVAATGAAPVPGAVAAGAPVAGGVPPTVGGGAGAPGAGSPSDSADPGKAVNAVRASSLSGPGTPAAAFETGEESGAEGAGLVVVAVGGAALIGGLGWWLWDRRRERLGQDGEAL